MEENKYILNEEDIRNLSLEQQRDYESFLDTVRSKGMVYRGQLEKFDAILHQQYKTRVLFNPNSLERYAEILAKNIERVLDAITEFRNDVVNSQLSFEKANFQNVNEGLDVLKDFVETNIRQYKETIGRQDLEKLLSRIDQLKSQITIDTKFYQSYLDERRAAMSDYIMKKGTYDNLSLFGKLAARMNGKKQELEEATQKYQYYNSVKMGSEKTQSGDILNPYQYEDYLEKQQPEEPTGGMKR